MHPAEANEPQQLVPDEGNQRRHTEPDDGHHKQMVAADAGAHGVDHRLYRAVTATDALHEF